MRSSNFPRIALIGIALVGLASSSAFAQGAGATAVDASTVIGMLKGSMAGAVNRLTAYALSWLGAFAALQFFITNYKLLLSDSDLQSALAKFVGAVAWVGVCILIIQEGPSFISAVGDSFFVMLGVDMPSTGTVVGYTLSGFGSMAVLAWGVGYVSNTIGFLLVCMALGLLAIGIYFAFKIFMLQLELAMIVMLSPLSFALLGLNTLRDQGIAPFKALISLGYRIILLTVILSAFSEVSRVLGAHIDGVGKDAFLEGVGGAVEGIGAAAGAYLLLCYLVFKSDSIAATLANGTTSMGTADVASAAAAGAAMGAAVVSGGAAVAGAASAPQSMRDFIGSMTGGGSLSNASAIGSAEPPPLPSSGGQASLSIGSPSGGSAGGPSGRAGASSSVPTSMDSSGPQSQAGSAQPSAAAEPEVAATPQAQNVATGRIGPDLSGDSQGQGSGQTASISGGNDMAELGKQIGKLAEQVAQSNTPKKPRLRDSLSEANRHMEKEQDRVQVSINPHHHD